MLPFWREHWWARKRGRHICLRLFIMNLVCCLGEVCCMIICFSHSDGYFPSFRFKFSLLLPVNSFWREHCLKMECLSWHFTLLFNTRNTPERKHIKFKCHCLVFHTTSTPSLCMQAIRTSYHWYSKQGHIDFWFSWNSDSAEHFFDLPVCSAFFSLLRCLAHSLSFLLLCCSLVFIQIYN